MTRVLIVTVGGSPEPILKAVELHQPDEVIFACSAPPCPSPSLEQVIGEGTPCCHKVADLEEMRPNLVTQLGLRGFRPDLQLICRTASAGCALLCRNCLHASVNWSSAVISPVAPSR